MSTSTDLAVDIAALIEATVAVEFVAVTAGEPAHTDRCSAAYVWLVRNFDSPAGVTARGDDAGCLYRRGHEFGYRIDVCHPPRADGREYTVTEHAAKAAELYDYADAVFCALMENAAAGTLFDQVNVISCEDIVIGEQVVGEVTGDRVSARGTLRVTNPCPPAGS